MMRNPSKFKEGGGQKAGSPDRQAGRQAHENLKQTRTKKNITCVQKNKKAKNSVDLKRMT